MLSYMTVLFPVKPQLLHPSFVPLLVKGNGPEWARGLNSDDYQLICPGKGPVPISDYLNCNLAKVPAHAVVTRPESRTDVIRILQDQQVISDSDTDDK